MKGDSRDLRSDPARPARAAAGQPGSARAGRPHDPERLVGSDRRSQPSPPALATPARRPRRQAEGLRRAGGSTSSSAWRRRSPSAASRSRSGGAPPRSRRRPPGTAGGAFAERQLRPARERRTPGFGGRGGFGGGAGAGLSINGTVKSVDGDTLTITTANGQTIEVTTGDVDDLQHAGARDRGRRQDRLDRAGPAPVRRQRRRRAVRTRARHRRGPIGTAGSVTVVP